MPKNTVRDSVVIRDYLVIAAGSVLYAAALCLFVYPRSFSFGGTSGLSVLLAAIIPLPESVITVILNTALMILALLLLGRQFALRTLVGSVLTTGAIGLMDLIPGISWLHTPWMWVDLVLAVTLVACGTAMLFSVNASSGGTDILAMIITSRAPGVNIGGALFLSDILIVCGAFVLYGVQTGVCSAVGLVLKSGVTDGVLRVINVILGKKTQGT